MARFPTPVPTPTEGKRRGFSSKLAGRGRPTPPAPPPPTPRQHTQSCRREQTRTKRPDVIPSSIHSLKIAFQGLCYVHAAKTYDALISRMIAEFSRG